MNPNLKYVARFLAMFGLVFFSLVLVHGGPRWHESLNDLLWETPEDEDKEEDTYTDYDVPLADSPDIKKNNDSLKYYVDDRTSDKLTADPPTQFDLKDPSNLKTTIELEPDSPKQFSISEKIGKEYYRAPTYMSFEEYMAWKAKHDEEAYFKKRQKSLAQISKKGGIIPKVNLGNALFDRIFGGTGIEVKPQGNVDLSFGGNWQNVKNPTLVQSAQRYGVFDFDMNMNISLMAKVGEKMKFNFSYNSKATFDFENQLKLDYAGQEDDIIKKIEAGYISFPLKTQLIQGVQSLFGLKTDLQFGRLRVSAVASQQRSKRESLSFKNGSQTQNFEVSCDNYEDFRHFLLSHSFRRNFNNALSKFPIIQSLNNINRLEVWVTNRNGSVDNARDVVCFMDLGEPYPHNKNFTKATADVTDNNSNTLYTTLNNTQGARSIGTILSAMNSLNLNQRIDYEKTYARKLNPTEYTFNSQLGFISINAQLQPDDVVGIAMEYTNNGKVYQVGDFAQNLPPDSTNPKMLFLKMLKSTAPDPTVPLWDLMMKNIYSLGATGVSNDEFVLNVMYLDPGGGEKRYLPEGPKAGIPLLNLLNLDRLNNQNDPQADGRFDFVEGITINSQQGKIIFPVLEPFGEDLRSVFGGNIALEKKYLYTILYDSTKNIAIQFPQFNRFLMKGTMKSATSSEIYLGGFNIPQGSVNVSAGGTQLVENVDYTIDYGIGKLKILNSGVLSSGIPVNVSYENNATFGIQQQNFVGTRLDYFVNDKVSVGGTALRLSERPYFNKVTFGEDPIKNTVLGLDGSYQNDLPGLTRKLDKLPLLNTTAPSLINAQAEVAKLIPGHNRLINDQNGESNIYIDDFEGTRSGYDLKFPVMSWSLASTPLNAKGSTGKILFPEANAVNDWKYGANRARLMWYNLDPCMVDPRQGCMPSHLNDTAMLSNHYLRLIQQQEVFPMRSYTSLQGNLTTLDLAYYPKERGPYNFDFTKIDTAGNLLFPTERWAGIMRPIDFSDFETSNVEFIEFWMLDPYLDRPNDPGGEFYINLGNVSEDILKDSRKSFENGLPFPDDPTKVETTAWSKIPKFQQQLTPAFDNREDARKAQDVGLDGMNNEEEKTAFKLYVDTLAAKFGAQSKAYLNALADPANDDYHHFRGEDYDNAQLDIFHRYRKFNNPQGNSPVSDNNSKYSNAFTNVPESEDINRDNTLNENEQYYQYRIEIKPNMQVGQNYIVNRQDTMVTLPNRSKKKETWYQFKVPIREFTDRIGAINDFRSIRFIRLFLNGFQDSVILRFGRFELGRNTWRRYQYSLKNPGELVPVLDNNATTFNLTSVSLEENSSRSPVPYVSPPGIQRVQQQVANGQSVLNNEQSISLFVCGLDDGDSRGAFKSLGMDMRQFKKLRMFIHAEGVDGESPAKDGDVRGFIRLGSDFVANYYEYQIPLKLTPAGTADPYKVWPESNNLDIDLAELIAVKEKRNASGANFAVPYEQKDSKGNYIRVIGNPNMGDVKNAMLGVLNPKKGPNDITDDGAKKCVEVWFNELRLSDMNEDGGYAATAKLDLTLADFATIKASGLMHTAGYGNIDQKVNQRFQDNYAQYAVSANVNLGKLAPKDWGVQLPLFVGYSRQASNPIYDPYDKDIKLEDKLKDYNPSERDSIRQAAQDATIIKSINVQNVRIAPTKNKHKEPWDLQNFDVSYAYSQTNKHNALIAKDQLDEHNASLGYTYSVKPFYVEPFKRIVPQKKKYFQLIRDVNLNLLPANVTIRNNLLRTLGETQVRNIDDGNYALPINYFKFFTWARTYSLRWDLTRSISFDYSANNQSRIDEPYGRIDTKEKKDTFWTNVKRLGRNTHFGQTFNANYNMPLNKIPLLDWTTIRGSYGATYDWTSASLLAKSLGNTIGNTQNKQINGEFNFTQLYNKWKVLKIISQPKKPTGKGKDVPGGKGEKPGGGERNDRMPPGKGGGGRDGRDGGDRFPGKGGTDREDSGGGTDKSSSDTDREETKKEDRVSTDKGGKEDRDAQEAEFKKIVEDQNKKLKDKSSAISKANKEPKVDSVLDKNGKKVAVKRKKKKKEFNPSTGVRILGNALMLVKRASFNYTENLGSTLPGYMDSTRMLGINTSSMNPGLPFAFGYQPDRYWLEAKGQDNVLTRDSLFNAPFTQMYSQSLNITANLEPFKDFKIDLNLNKTFNKGHTELFKDTVGGTNDYIHLNPYETGGFSISYIAIRTMFQKRNSTNNLTEAFLDFENNRQIISSRLGLSNPYTNNLNAPEDENYKKGYTRYAQEVLIPAFLSAYTGSDPKTYPLVSNEHDNIRSNPFKNIWPMPNWRVNYNGLARTKAFKNIFQSFTLTHSYTGTMSMNSFNSSLLYRDQFALGFPSFIDSVSHNYIPYFMVPNMTINETLGPLIGIDATFKSSLNFKVEIKKSRTLSMSLIDYQMSETKSKEITIGGGYRIKGVTINTPYFGLNKKKSDVNIKMDFSLRDDYTTINRLDQRESRATRGQKVISISPSIDYLLTQNLTLRFYYDRRQSIPYVSNSYPITSTRAGLMLRFLLGQ